MIKKICGLCETAIMLLLGAAILWFALSANYGLLMNVNFKWLTVTGAALVLLMGLAALSDLRRRPAPNTVIFGLMLLVVLLGRPYLPDARSMNLVEPPLLAGLWDQIDQARFPRKDLQGLCLAEAEEIYRAGGTFTTIGVAKRMEALDGHGSFALMTSVMYCCIADAFAIGLRVPYDEWEKIEDGQWIMISGKLAREEEEIPLPNFRFGMAMLSTVNKTYYLQPENVMSYDRVAQLPLLTERLTGQTNRLFGEALRESGLWRTLQDEGPFTVLVPVDQAIKKIGGLSSDKMTPAALKKLVASHIIMGRFLARDLMKIEQLETLSGETLHVELSNGKLKINGSRLLFKDTEARNGVIHFIYPAISPWN